MSEEDRVEQLIFAVTDFANAIEAAVVSLRKNVKGLAQFSEYDVEKIAWQDAQGQKGPYQKTDDVNNEAYKALREDLKQHNGKMRKAGYFLWVFQNGTTIGRKKVG